MKSKRRSGAVVLYGLLYLALTTGTAYLINQKHSVKPRPEIEALKKLGVALHFKRNGDVKYVDLFANRKVEEAMPYLAKLPELEMLTLSGTNVTDEQLKVIENLTSLTHLIMNDTSVSDAGLKHVRRLEKLQIINLDDCPEFTDKGIANLQGLKELEKIHMNHTQVTNAAVKHLLGLSKLKHVLAYDTKIDKSGMEELKKAVPKVNVIISEE